MTSRSPAGAQPTSTNRPTPAEARPLPPTRLGPLLALLSGRRRKFIPLVALLALSMALLALGGEAASTDDRAATLPAGAESAEVLRQQATLPQADDAPAIVVYHRSDGPLTAADRAAIAADRTALADVAVDGGKVSPAVESKDRRAALVTVPLESVAPGSSSAKADELDASIERIREVTDAGLPGGLGVEVTGPAAFQVDLSNVFEGADGRLLGATALVVALLLLVTYRSPWLWLVPLFVIGLADRVVASLIAILSREAGLIADGSTTGIVSVLVFGAGTNYALLLVARYREELRRYEDRHDAMRAALTHAVPAIVASSGTVALSLATLAFADLPFDRNIGLAGSAGIVTAVIFVLGLLPPALLLFGRGLFWPLVPRFGDEAAAHTTTWWRIGMAVTTRPRVVAATTTGVLAVLAAGALGANVGLSQSEQLRDRPDSVIGQETIARSFGPGLGAPTVIVAPSADAARVSDVVSSVSGVVRVSPGPSNGDRTQLDVQLAAAPGSDAAYDVIKTVRTRVDAVSTEAVVGGQDAQEFDKATAAKADRVLIVPLVLAVVLGVLLVLLRSVVAAVLLALTNVVSWAAALGASIWAFEHIFGFPGVDLGVPLLSFLFLVALGVDYNIFLITRAREEAQDASTREAIVTALSSTGGVITSAGILLAAVFTVLGVLPLITLTQLGIVVGFGILLDTLLVRTVLVPALVTAVGYRFWWPGDPAGRRSAGQ